MNSTEAAHEDVAAYALNLMEPDDAWRFERHLLGCEQCTEALSELGPVAEMLGDVDAKNLLIAEQSFREGRVLTRMIDSAAKQRSRTRALRLVSVAAGVVVLVIVSVLGAAVGFGPLRGQFGDGGSPDQRTQADRAPGTATVPPQQPAKDSANPRQQQPAAGCEIDKESKFTKTEASSGVKATVTVACENWGTPIAITLSNIVGPMPCQVVVKTKQGKELTVMDWKIPAGGYGTPERPRPLELRTVSDVVQSEIEEIQIRDTSASNAPKMLARVPLK